MEVPPCYLDYELDLPPKEVPMHRAQRVHLDLPYSQLIGRRDERERLRWSVLPARALIILHLHLLPYFPGKVAVITICK